MKNILITGAGGLLGKKVHKDLKDMNLSVYPVFRKRTSDNQDDPNAIFLDFSKKNWINKLPDNIDTVMHFANSSQFREFPDGIKDVLNINIQSTIELLEWSRINNIKKFIFTSTGNVYKNSLKRLDEKSPCLPDSMYAASKLSSEYFVEMYSSFFRTIILRPFGIYGKEQKHGLFFEIIRRVNEKRPIILDSGKGLEITPIHVSDASKAIIYLVNNYRSTSNHLLLNLASHERTNVKRIANLAANYLNRTPVFEEKDTLNRSYLADISLLESIWPVKKRTSLKEGIDEFISNI
jgi:UDP-glucose 4-epimerase